jgi:hypothetical protein
MADVKKGEIPEGYSNAVINEQTGKVELKEPMEGANESWPDATGAARRSKVSVAYEIVVRGGPGSCSFRGASAISSFFWPSRSCVASRARRRARA